MYYCFLCLGFYGVSFDVAILSGYKLQVFYVLSVMTES